MIRFLSRSVLLCPPLLISRDTTFYSNSYILGGNLLTFTHPEETLPSFVNLLSLLPRQSQLKDVPVQFLPYTLQTLGRQEMFLKEYNCYNYRVISNLFSL